MNRNTNRTRRNKRNKHSHWLLVGIGAALAFHTISGLQAQPVSPAPDAGKFEHAVPEAEDYELELLAQPLYDTSILPDTPLTEEEETALLAACMTEHLDPSLVLGLIYVESRFVPTARSSANCYGYCQLNPRYFPSDLSPAENITAGVGYLGDLMERYGCVESALTAYHDGHDTGNRTYANAVLAAAEQFMNDAAPDKQ